MIRLIVNADDLGSGAPRDRGILEAFARGIVTSASLLANGASFASAAQGVRACGLPTGVHLNLSEGKALTGRIGGVTDDSGNFPGKTALRAILAVGAFDRTAVRREFLAQIAKVRTAGLTPDHLDTHQHCLLFPSLTGLVAEAAETAGIRALRLPQSAEPVGGRPGAAGCAASLIDAQTRSPRKGVHSSQAGCAPTGFSAPVAEELVLYRQLAPAVRDTLQSSKLWTPDGLWGMPLLNRLNRVTLLRTLAAIPEGTWELMAHPGYRDAADPFGGPEREAELTALTSAEVRCLIDERGIRLTSFGACTCAC
jgi:predicted glycoside hydrolase/deacetylase ChbG (UPF0249 family)